MSKEFEALKARLNDLPTQPGVYIMKDRHSKIFYVGKAINLKNRVRSYFSGQDTRPFVEWLSEILVELETIVVRNNKEALLLEQTLIREHQPRFNIQLRDDKNYILLRLDGRPKARNLPLHQRYARLEIVRKAKNDGARYFGPYPSATLIRETVHLINKHFQLRTCNDSMIDNRARPCIQYQIGRCPAPCVYEIPNYFEEIQSVLLFLSGKSGEIEKRLKAQMWHAAEQQNYESAGRIRDKLEAIKESMQKQAANTVGRVGNEDALALARQGPLVEIAQVVVRQGRIMGTKTYGFKKQEFPSEDLLLSFLTQLYENTDSHLLPKHIYTALELPPETLALAEDLSRKKGSQVSIACPKKGRPKALLEIAHKNAQNALKERLVHDNLHEQALEALQHTLELARPPKVIECYDVSLFQGTDAVASRVCFVEGRPEKSRYRRYNIKTVEGTNDFAMLYETLTRRLKRGLVDQDLPDLLLVDGGKGQLSVALAALNDLKIPLSKDGLYVAGIAKARTVSDVQSDEVKRSSERLFIPGAKDPILLKAHTADRYLIERIRDEAHRFAITAHRARRKKRTLGSLLENIPGIGPKRRKILLTHFGSLENVLKASEEAIAAAPNVGSDLARTIYAALHQD